MVTAVESAQERLLEAAQEVFADRGFAAASIRDICKKAGVNIAAVNYYFRDKERLYIEAVKSAHLCAMSDPPMPEWGPDTSPWDKLRDFISTLAHRLLREHKPHLTQLIMRELAQPTAACAEVVRDTIRPMAEVLMSVLMQLMPSSPREECFMYGFSIMGQILIYKQNRPVVRGLLGEEAHDNLTIDQVVNHIYGVMHAAITARIQRGASA